MVVSDGLRSTLIWSKFLNFPGGACSKSPLECCAICVRTDNYVLRVPHQPLLYMHASLLQSLDPPLIPLIFQQGLGLLDAMNEVYNQKKWRTIQFGDECKKWLLLLLGLVDYDHNPETFLREFISPQQYTMTKCHQKFIIDQVPDIRLLYFQMLPLKIVCLE